MYQPAASAGPITFNTALPVAEDEVVYRVQTVWLRSSDDPSAMDRQLDVVSVPSVLAVGVHPRLTVFGVLPFQYKRLELSTPQGRVTRSTSGFADMTALVRATALKLDAPGRTGRLAPVVGLELPTGADDEADALGRLPQPFQLGSGSWDPMGGVIFTWQTLRWEVDVSAIYQMHTRANDFQAGDEGRLDASFQYRLIPFGELDTGVPSFFYGVIEANGRWRDNNEVDGEADPNSGGTTLHVTPGVQWVHKRWVIESAVQLPVVQELNGVALENDFIVRLSARFKF